MMFEQQLKKIDNAALETSPIPYFIIDNFLGVECRQLEAQLFGLGRNQGDSFLRETNEIALEDPVLSESPLVIEVGEFFKSSAFAKAISRKMMGFVKSHSGHDRKVIERSFVRGASCTIALTPGGENHKRRELHLDHSSTMVVFLYYIRQPGDFSSGGGLMLMSYERRLKTSTSLGGLIKGVLGINPTALNCERLISYKTDRLVCFAEGPSAFHEVETRRFASLPRVAMHGSFGAIDASWGPTNTLRDFVTDLIK